MSVDLYLLLKSVHDEQSFIEFIDALGTDFAHERLLERTAPSSPYSQGALGWENGSVDSFLGAAASWATASAQSFNAEASEFDNIWLRCASILLAGKFYE
ncbi:DUF7660 family protein [Pseudomonas gingeri]|uniref:DUF7660 family protein n=1 Tax=Pseudomonas gingeri TaxID=117681 RepID=UPI001C4B9494|nr:hypothetical protein [Pseudomonas gingeri]